MAISWYGVHVIDALHNPEKPTLSDLFAAATSENVRVCSSTKYGISGLDSDAGERRQPLWPQKPQ